MKCYVANDLAHSRGVFHFWGKSKPIVTQKIPL